MPAPPLDPGWRAISDFSPGIRTLTSPNHPPGTAQDLGTYRCYALSDGSLGPLPRLSRTIAPPAIPTSTSVPALETGLLSEQYRIIGLHANAPVFWPYEASPGPDQNNTELYLGVEYWDTTLQGQAAKYVLYRYKRHYLNNPIWETLWPTTNANNIDGVTSAIDHVDYDPRTRPKHFHFQTTRSNNPDPTVAGPAVTCFVVSGHTYMFPKDTDGASITSNTLQYLPGDTNNDPANLSSFGALISVDSLIGHQGRIVLFPLTLVGMGTETIWTTNESFYWTSVNDARTMDPAISGNFFNIVAGYENPNGYGVFASLTANELLLIKQRGGAIMIRGSLNSPTQISTLPYVRSTGLSMNNGTRSPLGYMYPVDGSGIWIWKGGDQSVHLTRNTMEPDFWRPESVSPDPPALGEGEDPTVNNWGYGWTQAADWNEWVLWPNNWLLDTDSDSPDMPGGAWWRIDDPDSHVIHQWVVSSRGIEAYGSPSGYRVVTDPAVYEYSIRYPASTFTWRSQPLSESLAGQIRIEEIGIIASGRGTVTVNVSSPQNPVGKTVKFIISDNSDERSVLAATHRLVTFEKRALGLTGTHIVFDILSESDDPDDPLLPAPTVHAIPYLPGGRLPVPLA